MKKQKCQKGAAHGFVRTMWCLALLSIVSVCAVAQEVTVTGRVVDETGEPLIAVTVKRVGTDRGTVTDMDGNYSLVVPATSTLLFSYVGFDSQEVSLEGRTRVDITLKETLKVLEEIVMVGYGAQRKSTLTGASSSVASELMENTAITDIGQALHGKMPGVQVVTGTGQPGTAAAIRVRGYSSNSANIGPLFVVDGLLVDDISYLDPSLIETIDVLKDAASASIYGAQAGNGVLLITTKRGKAGQSSISYDFKLTRQSLGRKPKILDAPAFIDYVKLKGLDAQATLDAVGYDGTDTDWCDVVFSPSWAQQHSLSFQGGNDKGHFFVNLNYLDNDGIVRGNHDIYQRLSLQINADYQITNWLNVGTNHTIAKWKKRSVPEMSSVNSLMMSCLTLDPLTPVYYSDPSQFAPFVLQNYNSPDGLPVVKDPENGLWYATSHYDDDDNGNPFIQRDVNDETHEGIDVYGTLFANLTPIEGLTITSRLGYRIMHGNTHKWSVPYFASNIAKATTYDLSVQADNSQYYQWENFANYVKTIDKHDMGIMAGMSYIENRSDNLLAAAGGGDILKMYAPNYRYLDFVTAGDNKTVGNLPTLSTQISYFGRLTYSYDGRYRLQTNFRADAFDTSIISKKHRWGYFPSLSAGWTVSQEEFFERLVNTDVLNSLKLRASWGVNGNVRALSNYQYAKTVLANSQFYQFNPDNPSDLTYSSAPDKLVNEDLTWETSEQFDVGVDAGLFGNRLTISMDWYRKLTRDLLVQVTPLPEVGLPSTMYNAGKVLNTGVEFEATWRGKVGALNYTIGANFATLKNEVLSLHSDVDRIESDLGGVAGTNNRVRNALEVGYPIWYFRGYKYAGVDAATGAPIYLDRDGNPRSAVEEGDIQYIGSAIPDFTYGINIRLDYKNFDFTLTGSGVAGGQIFNVLQRADRPWRNSLRYFYDNAWRPDNTGASMPDPAQCNDFTFLSSSAALFSGDYFKFKQIQLGYTLPQEWTKTFAVSRLRVYVSLEDFFTITSYPGLDPETATNTQNGLMGYDGGTYPSMRKVLFGLSVTF